MVKPQIVKEWFEKGEKDIKNAEFLFAHHRDLETVAFHIQQAAEKYLKGFLISKGRELAPIHDLVKLLQSAIEIDFEFIQYKNIAKEASNFYFEGRYPMGYEVEYSNAEIKEVLIRVRELIKLIKEKAK
ncbi:MAG: HEPN domain-containing protein [Candidatus Omnitrophota bacterium]